MKRLFLVNGTVEKRRYMGESAMGAFVHNVWADDEAEARYLVSMHYAAMERVYDVSYTIHELNAEPALGAP